jgi:hypothetical protein
MCPLQEDIAFNLGRDNWAGSFLEVNEGSLKQRGSGDRVK